VVVGIVGLFYGVCAVEALTESIQHTVPSRSGTFTDLLDSCTCKEKGERKGREGGLIDLHFLFLQAPF
jgi:hypothetical protein